MASVTHAEKLKIFTWHIHGSYLYYLSKGDYILYVPVTSNRQEGYYGRGETFPFGDNVVEIDAAEVKNHSFDCILFQSNKNYFGDQYEILSEAQRQLPRLYLEHDPPRKSPADTEHPVIDPEMVLVHVTHFNRLMWKNNTRFCTVIEHGVPPPAVKYAGNENRGIVVINHLHRRGRRLGADIFDEIRKQVPLDLAGMGSEQFGGLGEVKYPDLATFISKYRFFFNPIRYTSFGLAVCEAMMAAMPVVALATTEYPAVIRNGVNGYISNDPAYLIEKMHLLLQDPVRAQIMGAQANKTAQEQFSLERFTRRWKQTFQQAINKNYISHEQENSIRK